jgi:hypothetical protein
MKKSFVQCAEVLREADGDHAAPGGAVTLRLCGSWNHPGPCRWRHVTSAEWDGRRGKIRVVFAAPPEEAVEVRRLIERALADGVCVGPDGKQSRWQASAHGAGTLSEEEAALSASWETSS